MQRTLIIAQTSTCRYKMAALIIRNGKLLSAATNVLKSHPDHINLYPPWTISIHAEHHAINKARCNLAGSTLYVARYGGTTSKPCDACMQIIARAGIDCVVYMDTGTIVKGRL